MSEDGKTFMSELNEGAGAAVDNELVPLVKFLNRFDRIKTVSSHFGDDGCFVTVMADDFMPLTNCLFAQVQPMIAHLDGAMVEVFFSGGWIGIIRFTKAQVDEVSRRIGCWLEMLHK